MKYNGGDSGIKMPVLYWRCPLIRVSVITGSTVYCVLISALIVKMRYSTYLNHITIHKNTQTKRRKGGRNEPKHMRAHSDTHFN